MILHPDPARPSASSPAPEGAGAVLAIAPRGGGTSPLRGTVDSWTDVSQNSVKSVSHPHARGILAKRFVRILTKHLLPHTRQEIADAVGVTQKTVDNRLESLVNLDRCPKLLKIAALFEEAMRSAVGLGGKLFPTLSEVY